MRKRFKIIQKLEEEQINEELEQEVEEALNDGWKIVGAAEASGTPFRILLVKREKKNDTKI